MRASQAGYGALKGLRSIAETDLLYKKQPVYNSAWRSPQVAAIIMDIIKPDYIKRIPDMHLPRPDLIIDMTL